MDIWNIIKHRLKAFDWLLLIIVIGLSIFGVVIIGSATHVQVSGTSDLYENQKLWVASGLVLLFFAAMIDYKFIAHFFWLAYILNIGLLVGVLLFGDPMSTNVVRGLTIVGSFSIQPSEFAKIFMLIYLAKFIDKLDDKFNNIFVLLFVLISIVFPVYLIIRQPSLSAAIVVFSVSMVIVFVGGLSIKYIIPALMVILPVGYAIIQDALREEHLFVHHLFNSYQLNTRIIPFLRPEMASPEHQFQTNQSIRAIGSGQFSGKGLYNGTLNSLNYVPYSYNDFIFAVIGEEFGYIGCMAVLAVILLIILKCLFVAYRADTKTGMLIASGVAFMFAFQTFVNVGVAIGILPNTGMALPFISYGGSSMWINMIAIGLVINVGMSRPKSIFEK